MSYQKHVWVTQEIIRGVNLNHIESGIYDEEHRAIAAENNLSENISNEATRATNVEGNLSNRITTTDSNLAEHIGDTNNPHGVTKTQVGLGNVGNFKAVSTVASQGLTTTEQSNARTNIGAPSTSAATSSANGLMPKADKSKLDGMGMVTYGTCSTAAATAAKEVVISNTNWQLKVGSVIGVRFTATNTASSVTLNVNSTGAKSIYYNASAYTGNSNSITGYANRTNYYMYDGTYWVFLHNGIVDSNTRYDADAVCATAAGTAAKVASATGFVLRQYCRFTLRITTTNTAASALTLNVNSTGAKPIYINNAASSTTNNTLPAGDYFVYYNGTNYYLRTDSYIPGNIDGTANNVRGTVAIANGGTGATTAAAAKTNLGLDKVGNYKAVSTVANQGLTEDEKAAARANIGAGSASGTGTVTSVTAGAGLAGGTISVSGTIKANLKSETQSTLTAASKGSTSSREYAVGLDSNGNLSVNVPWTGTVTKVSAGAGLTGGDITTSGTIKADLKSETKSTLTAASKGSTSSREYAVGLDSNGNLSVNVPWTGTVTKVSAGAGLTGGDITTSGTIKADLKSETKSTLTAASKGSTSSREYAVGLDSAGDLSVNVPWTDTRDFKMGTAASSASNNTLIFVYTT